MKVSIRKDNNFGNMYWVTAEYGDDYEDNPHQSIFCTFDMLLQLEDEIKKMRDLKNDETGFHE